MFVVEGSEKEHLRSKEARTREGDAAWRLLPPETASQRCASAHGNDDIQLEKASKGGVRIQTISPLFLQTDRNWRDTLCFGIH